MTSSNADMAVYTTVPTPYQRERIQWRIGYLRVAFEDDTSGVVALATAPLTITPERVLRDTSDIIVRGMMLTYSALSTLGIQVIPDTYRDVDGERRISLTNVDSLANFERRHAIEYGALYLQVPFLERLGVAYETIAKHTPEQCETFNHQLDNIYEAARKALAVKGE